MDDKNVPIIQNPAGLRLKRKRTCRFHQLANSRVQQEREAGKVGAGRSMARQI